MMRKLDRATVPRILISLVMFGSPLWVFGCGKNIASLSAAPANASSGSYPADDTIDCLPDIPLVDQYGHRISLASFKGRPVLVDFIYADCATACPLLTAKFAAIAKLLGPELGSKVALISITIDPEHDHPAELLQYARSHGADFKEWHFLTGKPIDVVNVLRTFGLRRERDGNDAISHVTTCFLLGPDGRQERIYDALDVRPATVAADVGRAGARS